MDQIAQWQMQSGIVVNELADGYQVKSDLGLVGADVAISCLIKPEVGDWVLWSGGEKGTFILSVLQRDGGSSFQMQVAGELELKTEGKMTLHSPSTLHFDSGQQTELTSPRLNVAVNDAHVSAQNSHFFGLKSFLHIDRLSWVGTQLEQVAERVLQRFDFHSKRVSGHQDIQCQSSRHLVEKDYVVQSHTSLHHAQKNLHLDAEKIHLG
ncbi:DUF3540 domain-containing protein [Vibrio profundum]|uniref:DUF3540 domain-containing protein n=1 Tax=Vibrio profundum TaxID=2910247 RepID=UPI003D0B1CB8